MDADHLKKIDVFSDLPEDSLEQLARKAQDASADDGDVIVKQGTFSDQLLAIVDGAVEIREGDEKLATVNQGEVVGETGVVNRSLRNASVVAKGSVKVAVIAQSDIKALRRDHPEFDEKLQSVVEQREG